MQDYLIAEKSLGPRRVHLGFTLIEVMIVIAIIGILTAVALPSYRSYIERGDRAAARAAIMEAQQFMERFYVNNDSYSVDRTNANVALPARLAAVPVENPKYNLAISAVAVNSYTLTATPINAVQKCGNLTLTNTGVKGNSGSGTVNDCWR